MTMDDVETVATFFLIVDPGLQQTNSVTTGWRIREDPEADTVHLFQTIVSMHS
jgi:hypothetical protein